MPVNDDTFSVKLISEFNGDGVAILGFDGGSWITTFSVQSGDQNMYSTSHLKCLVFAPSEIIGDSRTTMRSSSNVII